MSDDSTGILHNDSLTIFGERPAERRDRKYRVSQGAELVEDAAQRPHITAEEINTETVIHSHQTFVMYWHSAKDTRLVNPRTSYIITAELRTQPVFKPHLC